MKTPEQLAEEYIASVYQFKSPSDWVEKNAFLAGYDAGVQSSYAQIKDLQKLVREYEQDLSRKDEIIEEMKNENT